MNTEEAVARYQELFPQYKRFTEKLRSLLEELLEAEQIHVSGFEHRVKDVASFRDKIVRKPYEDPLSEVTDLGGIRIISRRLADVPRIIELIRREFTVDEENSASKADQLGVNEFGYLSEHLVVVLSEKRFGLAEWNRFRSLKVEIQVRTILQHAWAMTSHSLDYKATRDAPNEFRRRLFRLSALFELADEEFDQLSRDIQGAREVYLDQYQGGITSIEVNVDSLGVFLDSSDDVTYWANYLSQLGLSILPNSSNMVSRLVMVADECSLKTIDDINRLLQEARGWGERFLSEIYNFVAFVGSTQIGELSASRVVVVYLLVIAANIEKLQGVEFDRFGYNYGSRGLNFDVRRFALQARGL